MDFIYLFDIRKFKFKLKYFSSILFFYCILYLPLLFSINEDQKCRFLSSIWLTRGEAEGRIEKLYYYGKSQLYIRQPINQVIRIIIFNINIIKINIFLYISLWLDNNINFMAQVHLY